MAMRDYEIVPYEDSQKRMWDSVVAASRNGNFLHSRNFIDYHSHRFKERSVIVQRNGSPVAVFPCNRVDDQIVSHGGLTYGGLIYGNALHAVDVLAIFDLLGEHYRTLGCTEIVYKAVPHVFHRYPAEEDLYALLRHGARLIRRDLSTVVQMADRIKIAESRKTGIRRARKTALRISEGNFVTEFHQLLSSVLAARAVTPAHTVQELELLRSRFPLEIRLFGAFDRDRLLAGALIFDFGSVAHSQYLASSEAGKLVGALDFLLEHLLDVEFAGRRCFSFGISTERQGQYLNEGLVFQKEGFGGRGVVHDFYEWHL